MKKKLLLLLCIAVLNFSKLYSQWNVVNVGTTQDLYSVDYYSLNDTWIGSFNQIVKTSNGGTNWIINPVLWTNGASIPGNMYDLALTGSSSAIGTGLFNSGNCEFILNTTNGASDWNIASQDCTVPLLRYIRSVDLFSTNAVAVGNNGRIAISNNSGSTWSFVTSGTSILINDVKYATIDTVFAVGNNRILKSVNGGANWTSTSISGGFKTVSCKRNVIYVASASSTLLKSTNYGTSYSTINLPFSCNGVIYAISKDTVLAASDDGLFISQTGGQYWEKYIIPSYNPLNMIDFLSPNNGFAVGDFGYAIKTNNLPGAPTDPVSSFTIQGGGSSFCLGDSITFINATAPFPGYSYQWKINSTQFSTQYNSGIRLNTEGTQNIYLIVNSGTGSAVTTIPINVIGHSINPVIYTASADTVCNGNIVVFTLPGSQVGVNYQLRKGFSTIGTAQSGTGDTLYFSSLSGVTSTTQFNIKAIKTTSCFTDSLVQNKIIYVYSDPGLHALICIPWNVASSPALPGYDPGIKNVTFGSINNTSTFLFNSYFDYSCCRHSDVISGGVYPISISTAYIWGEYVKVWIDYNNNGDFDNTTELVFSGFANHTVSGNITIPMNAILNQKIRMRVVSDPNSSSIPNCFGSSGGEIEDYAVTILPAPIAPTVAFSYTSTQVCSTTAVFTNTSYNATSYSWNFGDSSPVSTQTNPTHIYSVAGTYTISLTAFNIYGNNTSTQSITIVVPQTPIPSGCDPILTVCSDQTYITRVEQYGLPFLDVTGPNKDFTCNGQFYLMKDSMYWFIISTNCTANYFAPYLDANNDGLFSYPDESLFPGGQNQNNICGTSGSVYFNIPNTAPDSVPLRMRLALSNNYIGNIGNICSITCGDYKDFTVFLSPHPLTTAFSVYSPIVCSADSVAVNFTNDSKGVDSCIWYFGDGTTSKVYQPTHVYHTYGTYTVKLKTFGANSTVDSIVRTNYITFNQGLPIPVITLTGNTLSTTSVASSYQWYKDYNLIMGATSPSYTLTTDGTYYLEITNSNWCTTTSAYFSYYPVNANFTLGYNSFCADSVLVYFNNNSSNATSYTIDWGDGNSMTYNGSGGPIHYYPSGTYSIKLKACNDSSICDSTSAIFSYGNNVWPGDADASFLVDNNDLLPVGLHYSQTGAPRASVSNLWQPDSSACWGIVQTNGNDIKHIDCNGDGIIDANDTLAINLNFNSTHAIPVINNNSNERTSAGIYFVTNGSFFNPGDWVDAQVWLGSSSTPIADLYGIAFNINYDATLVQPGTESITYPASWLGTPGTDALKIAKIDALANTAYGGITRTDQTNANGYGKIADFKFQVKTSLTSPATMLFFVSNYKANDAIGTAQTFTSLTDSILIYPLTTGIKESNNNSGVTISPNPFTYQTNIIFNEEQKNTTVKIIDVLGKVIKTINFSGRQLTIEKEEMLEGIYLVEMHTEKGIISKKLVIQK